MVANIGVQGLKTNNNLNDVLAHNADISLLIDRGEKEGPSAKTDETGLPNPGRTV